MTGLSPGILPLLFSSIPLFILSSLSLEALWTPSRLILFIPHVRGQCVPHKNKPATQCEDLCVYPHPPTLSVYLSLTYLCPIDQNWLHSLRFPPPWSGLLRALTVQFYALLLQLLHGEQSRQSICEDTEGNELALCLVLTYRQDHVVKSVGQAFNKRKRAECVKCLLKASKWPSWKENTRTYVEMKQFYEFGPAGCHPA